MSKIVGIYQIQSLSKSERIYIGSSISIRDRWNIHKSDFRSDRRHARQFKRHVNKYGIDDLNFTIIEEFDFISKEHLLSREQYYMDLIKPYFNGCKIAGSPLGTKKTEEQKDMHRKISLRNGSKPPNFKGKKRTKEYCEKIRQANLRNGNTPPSRKGIKRSLESIEKQKETLRLKKTNNN